MGKFDEFAQAAEDMEDLGETPPVITQEGEPREESSDESGQFQVADENTSGGLGERVVEGEDAPFSIEEALGIGTPATEEATPEPAEEKPAEPEAPDTSIEARLKEMSDRVRHTEEQNRLLTEKLLQPDAPSGEQGATQMPELDQDVVEYMAPYIKAEVEERIKAIEASVEPIRRESENAALAEQIAEHVDGFSASDMPALFSAFDDIPKEKRPLYGEGVAGAIILAQKLANEGKFGQKPKARSSNSLAARHQTESGSGISGYQTGETSEAEKIKRLNNMSDEAVRDILDRMASG